MFDNRLLTKMQKSANISAGGYMEYERKQMFRDFIVNEKIFSFTISRYARSDRMERMCKAILI